ncbi:uncharacterized protein [Gossypium hirsutum]|uniref:Uncharacterized protein isoform X3 n=1 Tax=Gossypium hirsutum TaxID=3635 RepID=A0ABM3B684_GOSHI|nr:uncharacterized protein LOC107945575 isoform X3 [Gossypium hirsutum]
MEAASRNLLSFISMPPTCFIVSPPPENSVFIEGSLLGFSAGDSSIFYFVFRNMCSMEVHEDMYTAVESVEICLVSPPMDGTGKRLWEKVKY